MIWHQQLDQQCHAQMTSTMMSNDNIEVMCQHQIWIKCESRESCWDRWRNKTKRSTLPIKKDCSWQKSYASWKESVFEVILLRIFPHSDWIWRDTRIQSEYRKIWIRITPNTDTFYAVQMTIKTIKMVLTIKVKVMKTTIVITIIIKCRSRKQIYNAHNKQHEAPCDIS